MLDNSERFSVDVGRDDIGHVDEVDVGDVVRCAAPPRTLRQHVAMYDDVRRPDVLVNAEKTQVVQKRGVCVTHRRVVWTQHDVVHHVRYRETLCIASTSGQSNST